MKKVSLLAWCVILVVAIVLVIVLLMNSRTDTEIQNIEPTGKELVFEDVQTQIYERKNFLEKISAGDNSDITSILKRENPLNVFEAIKQQTAEAKTKEILSPMSPTLPALLPISVVSETPAEANTRNLGDFIGAIRRVGQEQGFEEERLNLIEEEVRAEVAASPTNLTEQFFTELANAKVTSKAPEIKKSFLVMALEEIQNFIKMPAIPKVYAQGGGLNFGGMVLFPFFCPCSGNWLVFMRPYPPSMVVMLTHYMGAQMFMNYNFPFTRFVLGKYTPGGAPCLIFVGFGCASLPSQGMTIPMIGTSPM